eukprot:m.82952 g.82952  ORF g.82952 m.82952 type:complete len:391 (+) comp13425_c0_seq1:1878-3050(+)
MHPQQNALISKLSVVSVTPQMKRLVDATRHGLCHQGRQVLPTINDAAHQPCFQAAIPGEHVRKRRTRGTDSRQHVRQCCVTVHATPHQRVDRLIHRAEGCHGSSLILLKHFLQIKGVGRLGQTQHREGTLNHHTGWSGCRQLDLKGKRAVKSGPTAVENEINHGGDADNAAGRGGGGLGWRLIRGKAPRATEEIGCLIRHGHRLEHERTKRATIAVIIGWNAHKASRVSRIAAPRTAKTGQALSTIAGLLASNTRRLGRQIAFDPPVSMWEGLLLDHGSRRVSGGRAAVAVGLRLALLMGNVATHCTHDNAAAPRKPTHITVEPSHAAIRVPRVRQWRYLSMMKGRRMRARGDEQARALLVAQQMAVLALQAGGGASPEIFATALILLCL